MPDSNQKKFKAGEIIMAQGQPGTSAYIIEEGRVEILVAHGRDEAQSFGTRGPGAMIGEMSLIDKAPRTATVKALEDCVLLEITEADFTRRLEAADPVLKMTSKVILTRYRDTLARSRIAGDAQNWPPAEAVELNHAEESRAIDMIKLANDFETALHNHELELHYQPIIDMQSGALKGFEALMRWTHPDKGFISPDVFIPVAEESGLIVEASKWALSEACKALRRIEGRAGFDHALFMSVNFSSRDFAADGFVEAVYSTLNTTGVRPENLHLEITERLLMGQPENARETLEKCKDGNIGISIDDFGTGFSSLSYLHHFPIDILKIDRSFVMNMVHDVKSMALVRSIITLGKNMGMKIIAEGVETLEESQILRDLQCDLAQGYYFAKPMGEADIIALLQAQDKFQVK